MLTYVEAKDDIRSHFKTFWDNAIANGYTDIPFHEFYRAGGVVPYAPTIYWHNVQKNTENDFGVHFIRFLSYTVASKQRGFSGGRIEEVGTKIETRGIAIVELYISKTAYSNDDENTLMMIAHRAFLKQRTTGGVCFMNAAVHELEPEQHYFRTNVTTQYVYDTRVT